MNENSTCTVGTDLGGRKSVASIYSPGLVVDWFEFAMTPDRVRAAFAGKGYRTVTMQAGSLWRRRAYQSSSVWRFPEARCFQKGAPSGGRPPVMRSPRSTSVPVGDLKSGADQPQ